MLLHCTLNLEGTSSEGLVTNLQKHACGVLKRHPVSGTQRRFLLQREPEVLCCLSRHLQAQGCSFSEVAFCGNSSSFAYMTENQRGDLYHFQLVFVVKGCRPAENGVFISGGGAYSRSTDDTPDPRIPCTLNTAAFR